MGRSSGDYRSTTEAVISKRARNNKNEKIKSVTARACNLHDPVANAFLSFFSQVGSFGRCDPIEHRWLMVETTTSFYVVQFNADNKQIIKLCESKEDCDRYAKTAPDFEAWTVKNEKDCKSITEEEIRRFKHTAILGDIVDYIEQNKFNRNYDLHGSNCQHLCISLLRYLRYINSGDDDDDEDDDDDD